MVKIPLPVSEGIPFETKGQLQRFLADQGLRRVTFRRQSALLERWNLTGFDQANWQYHIYRDPRPEPALAAWVPTPRGQ